jgi:hypothetical protein
MNFDSGELKQILDHQREQFENHVDMKFEKINESIGILTEMVAKNTEDIEMLRIDVATLKEMISKNTEDIEIMKIDINMIKEEIIIMRKTKADKNDIQTISKRIILLEMKQQ